MTGWKAARNENPVSDELSEGIRSFSPDLDATLYQDYLTRINGKSTTVWTLKDLALTGKTRSNIGLLCQDFFGYLRHHDGVPFTKLVWMLNVNGFAVDIRTAPLELQEEAFRKGLIPYVPGKKGI